MPSKISAENQKTNATTKKNSRDPSSYADIYYSKFRILGVMLAEPLMFVPTTTTTPQLFDLSRIGRRISFHARRRYYNMVDIIYAQ